MKKAIKAALAAVICASAALSFVGCGGREEGKFSVYCPDGAPALSLVNGMQQGDDAFEYRVIDSSTVQGYVTGANPQADFCVLPVNLASKLLGSGESYQMLGTVTNGNLYFLTTGDNPELTAENLKSTLIGKTVGSVQLANVPGLTLQAVLKDYDVPYTVISGVNAEKAADRVNLLNVDAATEVTPVFACDYFLCPEPAVTAKIKGTASSPKPFKLAGDLQALYGGEGGYPQAVLVGKKSVIAEHASATKKLVSYFEGSAEYLAAAQPADILAAINGALTAGMTPSFSEKNLNADVIAHCSVRFTPAKDCKDRVNAFLEKLHGVNANAASAVNDAFYYMG